MADHAQAPTDAQKPLQRPCAHEGCRRDVDRPEEWVYLCWPCYRTVNQGRECEHPAKSAPLAVVRPSEHVFPCPCGCMDRDDYRVDTVGQF